MGKKRAPIEKTKSKGGMYKVSNFNHMNAKVDAPTQKIDNLSITLIDTINVLTPNYNIYGVPRCVTNDYKLLAEPTSNQANYAQGKLYSNTYNPGWRNHLNFSYKNNNALFAPNLTPTILPGFQI